VSGVGRKAISEADVQSSHLRDTGQVALLAVLVCLGTSVAPAEAVIPSGNLVVNGDAESGAGSTDASTTAPMPIPSWTSTANFTEHAYDPSGAFPSNTVSDGIGGGAQFFAGGPQNTTNDVETASQAIGIADAAPEIDMGAASATVSADLGGFATQDDNAAVTATFLSGDGTALRAVTIGPVMAADRGSVTTMVARSATVAVPTGARSVQVTIKMTKLSGTYNDGYADNVSLALSQSGMPGQLPPPTAGSTVNAVPESGTVLVKVPPGSTPKAGDPWGRSAAAGFVPLAKLGHQIPVGSTLDTTKGKVHLITAAKGTKTQDGHFNGGLFVVQQGRKNPLTTLSMNGVGLTSCSKLPPGGAPRASAAAPRKRSLFSNVKGRFRTRGRNSSATVRGTSYEMTDTCAGTLTRVKQGTVIVRDFKLRKSITLKAGQSYFAHAPPLSKKH
jgi:hypothetical protein